MELLDAMGGRARASGGRTLAQACADTICASRSDNGSVAVVDPAGPIWRKARWPLLLVVFVVLPGAAVFGNWAIFHLFGNGSYLPFDSTGDHVLRWWDGWGRPLMVGVVAWLLLTIR